MPETPTPTPHTERIRRDLNEIRSELIQTVQELGPEALDWSPKTGLKTVKEQLQEIGTMESLSRHMASHGETLDWGTVWQSLDGPDAATVLTALAKVRGETLTYLDSCTEEKIETPIPLAEDWQGYFGGAKFLEPEVLLRWIVRHEYYHLAQLNAYAGLRATPSGASAASSS